MVAEMLAGETRTRRYAPRGGTAADHTITRTPAGYTVEGKAGVFGTLSAAAHAVTGVSTNGNLFWLGEANVGTRGGTGEPRTPRGSSAVMSDEEIGLAIAAHQAAIERLTARKGEKAKADAAALTAAVALIEAMGGSATVAKAKAPAKAKPTQAARRKAA